MSIDLKRFVNVNIKTKAVTSVSSTRPRVILFTPETTSVVDKVVHNQTEADTKYPSGSKPITNAYLTVFFNNGGLECQVIEGKSYSTLTASDITALDNAYIVYALADTDANVESVYTKLKTLMSAAPLSELSGIDEKIAVARTKTIAQTDSIPNMAVKYSTVLGAEMAIAAYLSQIDVYRNNSIADYAFTRENLGSSYAGETITDANYADIISNNMNVDIYLANAVRNCGGNMKDGKDIVNEYCRIILCQTLTDRLITLLSSKIKGNAGLALICSTMADELGKYLVSGYISTDKTWTDPTYTVTDSHGVQYTIIEKDTPLTAGYQITVLPFSSLSTEDIAARKVPDIYVIIGDQYGIRKIAITGDVI